MRLYDRIVAEDTRWVQIRRKGQPPEETASTLADFGDAVTDSLQSATVLCAQSVREAVHQRPDEVVRADELFNILPPWSPMFVEWRASAPKSLGYLFTSSRTKGGWEVDAVPFLEFDHPSVAGRRPAQLLRWYLDEAGAPTGFSFCRFDGTPRHHSEWDEMFNVLRAHAHIALLAITLCHCKNVDTREVEPNPKLVKKHAKRGKKLHRYHVLEIDPMRSGGGGGGTGQREGLTALHLRRGYFADYRDRGLFGKHKGVFWFSPALRGNAKNGVVEKDYAVNPEVA